MNEQDSVVEVAHGCLTEGGNSRKVPIIGLRFSVPCAEAYDHR